MDRQTDGRAIAMRATACMLYAVAR